MNWQDTIVILIGLAAVAITLRAVIRHIRRRGGCDACESTDCPIKKIRKEK